MFSVVTLVLFLSVGACELSSRHTSHFNEVLSHARHEVFPRLSRRLAGCCGVIYGPRPAEKSENMFSKNGKLKLMGSHCEFSSFAFIVYFGETRMPRDENTRILILFHSLKQILPTRSSAFVVLKFDCFTSRFVPAWKSSAKWTRSSDKNVANLLSSTFATISRPRLFYVLITIMWRLQHGFLPIKFYPEGSTVHYHHHLVTQRCTKTFILFFAIFKQMMIEDDDEQLHWRIV